jgi:hypothetical protein
MLIVAGIGDAMGAFLDRVVQCENADDDSKKYQLSLFLCLQLAREVDYTLCTTPEWNLVMFACGSQFHHSLRSRVGRPRTVNRGKQISEQQQKVGKRLGGKQLVGSISASSNEFSSRENRLGKHKLPMSARWRDNVTSQSPGHLCYRCTYSLLDISGSSAFRPGLPIFTNPDFAVRVHIPIPSQPTFPVSDRCPYGIATTCIINCNGDLSFGLPFRAHPRRTMANARRQQRLATPSLVQSTRVASVYGPAY